MKVFELVKVEFGDIVRSNKFVALTVIFTLMLLSGLCRVMEPTLVTENQFAGVRRLGFEVARTIGDFVCFLVPIVAIVLGYDSISGKIEKGAIKALLAQPIYRDQVILSVIIAGLLALALNVVIPLALALSTITLLLGITPTLGDIVLLTEYMACVMVFALAYYSLSVFISAASSNSTRSLVAGIMVWLVFSFMLPRLTPALIRLIIGPPRYEQTQMGNIIVLKMSKEYIKKYTIIRSKILSFTLDYHFRSIQDQLLLSLSIRDYSGLIVLLVFSAAALLASFIVFVKKEVR